MVSGKNSIGTSSIAHFLDKELSNEGKELQGKAEAGLGEEAIEYIHSSLLNMLYSPCQQWSFLLQRNCLWSLQ